MINIESLVKRTEKKIHDVDSDDYLCEFGISYCPSTKKWHISTIQADPHKWLSVVANSLPEALKLFKNELRDYG